ncbi:hypothetical protein Tco_1008979 [Tanacetum coccineum]
MKLTHLCFVDDLLILCNGDKESLGVIKKVLNEFSSVSGSIPNLIKSSIFFGSINEGLKRELLKIIPFNLGSLPMIYLGVPLIAKKLSVKDCKCLVDNVEKRINCWRNKQLSYADRIQLIVVVLCSMYQYWASLYILPLAVVKDLDKLFKRFLWISSDSAKGKARVKWVNTVKLKGKRFWELDPDAIDSSGWKSMLEIKDKVKPFVIYNIRDDRNGLSKSTLEWRSNDLQSIVEKLYTKALGNKIHHIAYRLIISSTVYHIWNEKNKRSFQNSARPLKELIESIEGNIRDMLESLTVKNYFNFMMAITSSSPCSLELFWGIFLLVLIVFQFGLGRSWNPIARSIRKCLSLMYHKVGLLNVKGK